MFVNNSVPDMFVARIGTDWYFSPEKITEEEIYRELRVERVNRLLNSDWKLQ